MKLKQKLLHLNLCQQIDWKHSYKCKREIPFANIFQSDCQMEYFKVTVKWKSTKAWGWSLHICKRTALQTHHRLTPEILGSCDPQGMELHSISRTQTYCLIKWQYYWKGMNKDIQKYIAPCALCCREKAKVQAYPLQMTDTPECPFDKITMDLVTKYEISNAGNKHILTMIDHLMGSPEAFPIPDKSADTIVSTFINQYLPVNMYPRYILSDNGTEFKYHLMDQVLKQLGIECIFSAPYHPQFNRKSEVFHKYLKPTKKLCEKDPPNWDKYINQVLASYRVTPNLATAETPFFLVYGRDPSLPLHQLLEPMQQFLGDPESGLLNLEAHHLALAIAKKTLDENCFRTVQTTTNYHHSR